MVHCTRIITTSYVIYGTFVHAVTKLSDIASGCKALGVYNFVWSLARLSSQVSKMQQINVLMFIVVAVLAAITAAQTGDFISCSLNVSLLDQYIEEKVNSILADEPGMLQFKSTC